MIAESSNTGFLPFRLRSIDMDVASLHADPGELPILLRRELDAGC